MHVVLFLVFLAVTKQLQVHDHHPLDWWRADPHLPLAQENQSGLQSDLWSGQRRRIYVATCKWKCIKLQLNFNTGDRGKWFYTSDRKYPDDILDDLYYYLTNIQQSTVSGSGGYEHSGCCSALSGALQEQYFCSEKQTCVIYRSFALQYCSHTATNILRSPNPRLNYQQSPSLV